MSTNTVFGDLFGSGDSNSVSDTLSDMIEQNEPEVELEEVVEEEPVPSVEEISIEEIEIEDLNLQDKGVDLNAADRRVSDDDYDLEDLQAGLEFADNMDPRAPVIVLADASGSMSGEPIAELNRGIKTLFQELKNDELASRRVELSVIAYGSGVNELTDFTVVQDLVAPDIKLMGLTETGAAVEYAIDKIEARKEKYKNGGVEYYRPIILLITDGASTDDVTAAAKRVAEGEEDRKFSFFAVGVEGADMNELKKLTPRGGLQLQGYKFNELFKWLSASVQAVSASNPGDTVALPDLSGWAKI